MRKSILIVDDVEINRVLLVKAFEKDYDTLEACDGEQALEIMNGDHEIAAVLLDLKMPKLDGTDVLKEMNRTGKIKDYPVFLITAAEEEKMLLEGYDLGAIDIITKPFRTYFLKCRVNNVIELYRHRNELENIVAEQLEHLNAMNQSIVETLATVIEFRSCESGEHVKRVCSLTGLLMAQVSKMYPEYALPRAEIDKIITSSILHDIGKIAIPDQILNKPGKLTNEEFEIMKEHTIRGCEVLQTMPDIMDKGVYNYSYDICRHHHERWDGRGYPDGLSGDDISIWAQVVSVIDVYDALTSKRVYKKAFTHETAVKMIRDGECGTFNPKVIHAFETIVDKIEKKAEQI